MLVILKEVLGDLLQLNDFVLELIDLGLVGSALCLELGPLEIMWVVDASELVRVEGGTQFVNFGDSLFLILLSQPRILPILIGEL